MIFRSNRIRFQLKNICTLCSPSVSRIANPYEPTKILSSHFKLGNISEAEKLFEKIPEKDVVSWSIMVHGYAKHGYHERSVEAFSRMRMCGVVPNSFTMVGAIIGVAGFSDLWLQCVHGLIVKNGQEHNLIVGTALLDVYAGCGNIGGSYKVFQGLKNPGLISFNAAITGFVYNDLFKEALVLFNQLRMVGLVPGIATMVSIVQACAALGSLQLESVHCLIMKVGLSSHASVNNSILNMYSNLLDLSGASKIFHLMDNKDIISWATMMSLFIRLERATDVMKLFHEMTAAGANPDVVVVINLISACAILGDSTKGRQVQAQVIVYGFVNEVSILNSLVAMYSKCGQLDLAKMVFDRTSKKTVISWTAIISGYAHFGRPHEALRLWVRAREEENFRLDSISLVGVLVASAELAALDLCEQLHCHAFGSGLLPCRAVQNSLISAYSKCGLMEPALRVFEEMGCHRDIVSWNVILKGFGVNGAGETAVSFYNEMRMQGVAPDSATYLIVLNACSHAGLVEDGLSIFNEMADESRIRPHEQHLRCLVDLLARAGCLSVAHGFADKVLEQAGPDVWKALLSGCLVHGNVELAELAARRLSKQETRKSDQVVLLSNVYASAGRFKDAEVLRSSMENERLTKNEAVSAIHGRVHDFG
ncbi:pentatricopeptide repeat-containing protein At1g31430-like [Rhodamnia argentea]|uniref:Pentatricopeptide repeat-containing protein At1g31430-like n=1 Tax=Rhodamnia argentea TaxID=178133 RepID=A0ABM3GXE4_9MYRT|nr:pentatricopeptide repeat-containing protein At1g31430-like [Rhodamnia argentea]